MDKYNKLITFVIMRDETWMEAITPRTIWVNEMGYEVDVAILESYAQMLINAPKEPNIEIFGTTENIASETQMKASQRKRKKYELDAHKFIEQVIEKLIEKLGIDPRELKIGEIAEEAKPTKIGPTIRHQQGRVIYKDPKEKMVVTKRPKQKEKREQTGKKKRTKKSEEEPKNTLVEELVDSITNRNTLKHIKKHYSKLNDKEKGQIENAILLYLDGNKIPLINIFDSLLDELYSMLDGRKNSIIELDKTMKIKILTRMQPD